MTNDRNLKTTKTMPARETIDSRRRRRHFTCREIVDWYFANHCKCCPQTMRDRRSVLGLFMAWRPAFAGGLQLGDTRVDDCRALDLVEFLNMSTCPHCGSSEPPAKGRHGGMCAACKGWYPKLGSAWTRKRWANTCILPFRAAYRLGLIRIEPFRGITCENGPRGRDLTDDEFRSLLRLATPPFRRVLIFLRFSGARPGELSKARWEHFAGSWTGNAIVLPDHKTARKTKEPRRIVLNPVLVKLLAWIHRNTPASPFIFVNSFGRPWRTSSLCKNLRVARRKIGLAEDVKLYSNRHAFATGLIARGEDVSIVAELLGHKGLQNTSTYLHVAGLHDRLNRAVELAMKPYGAATAKPEKEAAAPVTVLPFMPRPNREPAMPAGLTLLVDLLIKKLGGKEAAV